MRVTSSPFDWSWRFAGRPRATALALVALVGLIVWGCVAGSNVPESAISDDPSRSDTGLYSAIIDRMDDGSGYYSAAALEQSGRGYPTRPAMTVREPTLAWATAVLGRGVTAGLLWALIVATIALAVATYDRTERARASWAATAIVTTLAVGVSGYPLPFYLHDVWAGVLICLGLLCFGRGWLGISVMMLLCAALVRELAAPVMGVLFLRALWHGRRREAIVWLVALLSFGAFYVVHAARVHQLVPPSDLSSPGWLAHGGWPFVVDAVRASSALTAMPDWVAAVVVPVALLGWVTRQGGVFAPVSAVLLAFVGFFCVVGRPDNIYWGSLLVPLLLPGLVFGFGFIVYGARSLRPQTAAPPPDGPPWEGS
jgi:hypothetical protein